MPITWLLSAFKHELPEDEIIYAMLNAHHRVHNFGRPRIEGGARATLYIGPSRFGTLEVLAYTTPPDGIVVFHAMPLRESTRAAAGYQE